MTVNYVGGVDYNQYQRYNSSTGVQNGQYVTYSNASSSDAYISSSGETCTDGKDDGKIGFFSAVGNAIKGVGKTIVNGVKGMFTDKDGNFSLGKTLLSIGTAALCIAVPAVGVAACVVGGAMGAVQVGKGIYNAATADTDAEAKQAWQDIGGGTFTVAASVVGAKAGVKAVKATSSAGGAKGVSALSQLDDAATMGQKAAALGKDMVSSTKNQLGSIKNAAAPYAQAAKIKAAKIKADKAVNPNDITVMTKQQMDAVNNYQNMLNSASPETKAILSQMDDFASTAKSNYGKVKTTATDAIKHPIQTGKNVWNAAKGKVTKENAQNLWSGIQDAYNNNIKGQSLSQLGNKLTGTAKNIWSDLSTGKYSYQEAVSKYGFENVAQVIQYMGGTVFASEAI